MAKRPSKAAAEKPQLDRFTAEQRELHRWVVRTFASDVGQKRLAQLKKMCAPPLGLARLKEEQWQGAGNFALYQLGGRNVFDRIDAIIETALEEGRAKSGQGRNGGGR